MSKMLRHTDKIAWYDVQAPAGKASRLFMSLPNEGQI